MASSAQFQLQIVSADRSIVNETVDEVEVLAQQAPAVFDAVRSHRLQLWPDAEWRRSVHQQLGRGEDVPSCEAQLRRQSGDMVDVAFSACRVQIGGRAHFVAMLLDITPQQQAQQALQRIGAQAQLRLRAAGRQRRASSSS